MKRTGVLLLLLALSSAQAQRVSLLGGIGSNLLTFGGKFGVELGLAGLERAELGLRLSGDFSLPGERSSVALSAELPFYFDGPFGGGGTKTYLGPSLGYNSYTLPSGTSGGFGLGLVSGTEFRADPRLALVLDSTLRYPLGQQIEGLHIGFHFGFKYTL